MIEIEKKDCCGCGICMNSCPSKCISMKKDDEGFLFPNIDKDKCTNCGLCEKYCPVKNPPVRSGHTFAFAAQNRFNDERKKSTSGGMFSVFAKQIINEGGYVCGVGYSEDGEVIHKIINSIEELNDLIGSKYVQSNTNKCFSQIIKLLKEDKIVLFVGTPCQCAGLKNISQRYEKNLILVDIVCYGVPSPMVYEKWIDYLEKKYNKKIKKVFFRDKTYGYASPNVKIIFSDESFKEQTIPIKTFMKLFMNNISIRKSCYDCKFKGIERTTDITLGDCWSIGKFNKGMDDNFGTTAVYIHSEKGMIFFNKIKNKVDFFEIDVRKEVEYDGKKIMNSAEENSMRKQFFDDIKKIDYKDVIKKYAPTSIKERIICFLKRNLGKLKISKLLLKWIKNLSRKINRIKS